MKLQSTQLIILRTSIIIAFSEFLIMLFLNFFPFKINTLTEAALDVILLALLSTPAIYFGVVKPFVVARDVALSHISNLALSDPLTGLANRRQLLIQLKRVISNCKRNRIYGSLLLIDLDGFKEINDLYGHDAGDATLIEISKQFSAGIRSEDFISRMGGDEFVVLLENLGSDAQHARHISLTISNKLIDLASSPINFNQHNFQIGASIGIHLIGFDQMDADTALREADVAMYRSKKTGKGRAIFFD